MLHAGEGLMLLREERPARGARRHARSLSPLVQAEYSMSIAHQASRKEDPLIKAFVDAAAEVWPELRLAKPRDVRRG